eukprot:scaffold164297_cov19-Tisochrysis_lutea.AAC.1
MARPDGWITGTQGSACVDCRVMLHSWTSEAAKPCSTPSCTAGKAPPGVTAIKLPICQSEEAQRVGAAISARADAHQS